MNRKPVYSVPAKSIINFKSDFEHKLLCDGLAFSTGSACAYSCSFCYVEGMMNRTPHTKEIRDQGIAFEDVVIRRSGAIDAVLKQLLKKDGSSKFLDPNDRRVIYASPLVDVAANITLARETAEVCKLILEHTHWQIRLLSKSNLLPKLAEMIPDQWKDRMIFGVSTGTLDDNLAKAFEKGTARVSKRIESLHWLQDQGYRTFGMICPSLPQEDYVKFSKEITDAIRVDRCEHVWAEVINLRGKSFTRTIDALNSAGLKKEAEMLEESHKGPKWEEYARSTFEAHKKHVGPDKLRFMQYPKESTIDWWKAQEKEGALVLGKLASDEKNVVSSRDKARFKKLDSIVTKAAKSFVDAGMALYEIRSQKLYRHKFKTFEEYCQSVHSISRQYANSLVRAGKATKELETIVSKKQLPLPNNEAQVRELIRVSDPDERAVVYKSALEVVDGDSSRLTAAVIRDEVTKHIGSTPTQKKAVTPSSRITKAIELADQIEDAYNDNQSIESLLRQLREALAG